MLQEAPPAWFRDEVHVLITRGDISPEEGLLTMIHPPSWAYGPKPAGAGTIPPLSPKQNTKVCACCWLEFPIEDFYVKPDGQIHNLSRPCESARQRKRRAAWSAEKREAERAKDRLRLRKKAA